jgi:hypothetical protein
MKTDIIGTPKRIATKALDIILDHTSSSTWEDVCKLTWKTNEVQELLIKALKQGQTLPIDSIVVSSSNICTDTNQECKHNCSSNCEQKQLNKGDLVPLVWMIEKLRRKEGGCTMNELFAEAKRNFKGIEDIKHKTINYY